MEVLMFIKNHCWVSIIIILALPLLLTSCAKKINISHMSYANKQTIPQGFPLGSSFVIESLHHENTMIEQDIAHKIELILQNKGYSTKESHQAQYCLLFNYRIQQTKKTADVVTYVPGKVINSYRSVVSNGNTKLYQDRIETPGKFVTVPEVHILFTKSVVIQIFDAQSFRQESAPRLIWQGSAQYCDENNDLRDALDYLLITSLRDLGIDTQKNILTTISSDDKEILQLHNQLFCN